MLLWAPTTLDFEPWLFRRSWFCDLFHGFDMTMP
jgi:hypothetical protein